MNYTPIVILAIFVIAVILSIFRKKKFDKKLKQYAQSIGFRVPEKQRFNERISGMLSYFNAALIMEGKRKSFRII